MAADLTTSSRLDELEEWNKTKMSERRDFAQQRNDIILPTLSSRVLIIGRSGVGKSTICSEMFKVDDQRNWADIRVRSLLIEEKNTTSMRESPSASRMKWSSFMIVPDLRLVAGISIRLSISLKKENKLRISLINFIASGKRLLDIQVDIIPSLTYEQVLHLMRRWEPAYPWERRTIFRPS